MMVKIGNIVGTENSHYTHQKLNSPATAKHHKHIHRFQGLHLQFSSVMPNKSQAREMD